MGGHNVMLYTSFVLRLFTRYSGEAIGYLGYTWKDLSLAVICMPIALPADLLLAFSQNAFMGSCQLCPQFKQSVTFF